MNEEKTIALFTFLKSAIGKYKKTIPTGIIIVFIKTKSNSNLPWIEEFIRRKAIKNTSKSIEFFEIFLKSSFFIINGKATTNMSIKIFGSALTYSSKGIMKYNKIKT